MALDDNRERLTLRGRLAVKEAEARRLRMLVESDIAALRALLDPFAPVEELRMEAATEQMIELAGRHAEYVGVVGEMRAMRRALGL